MTEDAQKQTCLDQYSLTLIDEKQWLSISRRFNMTPRELEVAKLVCRGFTNEQIGEILDIKAGTVKTHIRNLYRRVNAQNRIGILLRFLKYLFAPIGHYQKAKPEIIVVDKEQQTSASREAKTTKDKRRPV